MSQDPRTYRFQIRQVTRSDFSERPTYGGILWEESLLRIQGMQRIEHRVRLAGDTAERIARERKCEVVVCLQPLDGGAFIPEYFIHHCSDACSMWARVSPRPLEPPHKPLPPLSPYRLGDSKFIYGQPERTVPSPPAGSDARCGVQPSRPGHDLAKHVFDTGVAINRVLAAQLRSDGAR